MVCVKEDLFGVVPWDACSQIIGFCFDQEARPALRIKSGTVAHSCQNAVAQPANTTRLAF
jgi:hypothetical protein